MGVETRARGLTAAVAMALRPALLAASEDRFVDKITADYAEGHIDIQFQYKAVKFETSLQDSILCYMRFSYKRRNRNGHGFIGSNVVKLKCKDKNAT